MQRWRQKVALFGLAVELHLVPPADDVVWTLNDACEFG